MRRQRPGPHAPTTRPVLAVAAAAVLIAAGCSPAPTESRLAPWFARYTQDATQRLDQAAGELRDRAEAACAEGSPADARGAWTAAATAWLPFSGLDHPGVEANGLTFRLWFWPDTRDRTGAELGALLEADTPIDAAALDQAPAAVDGLGAVEWLLWQAPTGADAAEAGGARRCDLLRAVTARFASHVDEVAAFGESQPLVAAEWTLPGHAAEGDSVSVNLLYRQLSGLAADLRTATDEAGAFTAAAHGWRSGATPTLYAAAVDALIEHLTFLIGAAVHTPDTLAAITRQRTALADAAEALRVCAPQACDTRALKQHLADLERLVRGPVSGELDVLIGFSNSDGD